MDTLEKIQEISKRPFDFLDHTYGKWLLILYCSVFAAMFMYVFQPFNINLWFKNIEISFPIIVAIFSLTGMLALIISQFILRYLFQLKTFTYRSFLGWFIFELMFLSVVVHVVNAFITSQLNLEITELFSTLKYTTLLLILPYSTSLLFLYLTKQQEVIAQLRTNGKEEFNEKQIIVKDENNKVVFSVGINDIMFIKSEDNYVHVYYLANTTLKKELIRTSLKKLSSELQNKKLIRINRSYIVNVQNIASVKKSIRGYVITMKYNTPVTLTVTKTHKATFESMLYVD